MTPRGAACRGLALALVCLGVAACGKRGDPLPPLRRNPRPVTGFSVAQLGSTLEVRFTAPTASVDGVPFDDLVVELLRAEGDGAFDKLARTERHETTPGGSRTLALVLPAPGTRVRLAVQARSGRHVSRPSDVVDLVVGEPPPAPEGFAASHMPGGIALSWRRPEVLLRETAPPEASATTAEPGLEVEAGQAERSEMESTPGPQGAPPANTPLSAGPPRPGEAAAHEEAGQPEDAPGPSPPAEAKPKPPPKPPQRGVYVYRRTEPGDYVAPLTSDPLQTEGYVDASGVPDERYCYVARSVVARDPLVASEPTEEVCLAVRDLEPPPAPVGATLVSLEEGLEVSWSPLAPGVSSLRVFRRDDGGPPRLLAELPADATRWVDADAPRGPRLVYLLVALDAAGNESAPATTPPITRR